MWDTASGFACGVPGSNNWRDATMKSEKNSFIQIPRFIFEVERYKSLSASAILLYALLLDRYRLSQKNPNAWKNKDGHMYICYPITEVQMRLRCGHDKATSLFRELELTGLIKRAKPGLGRASQIVVYDPAYTSAITDAMTADFPGFKAAIYRNSREEKTANNNTIGKDYSNVHNQVTCMNHVTNEYVPVTETDFPENISLVDEVFAEIYNSYSSNKKKNRQDDYVVFKSVIKTDEDAILARKNFAAWMQSANWKNENARYVPRFDNFVIKGYWRRPPPELHSSMWGSGDLGAAELEAIKKVLRDE